MLWINVDLGWFSADMFFLITLIVILNWRRLPDSLDFCKWESIKSLVTLQNRYLLLDLIIYAALVIKNNYRWLKYDTWLFIYALINLSKILVELLDTTIFKICSLFVIFFLVLFKTLIFLFSHFQTSYTTPSCSFWFFRR